VLLVRGVLLMVGGLASLKKRRHSILEIMGRHLGKFSATNIQRFGKESRIERQLFRVGQPAKYMMPILVRKLFVKPYIGTISILLIIFHLNPAYSLDTAVYHGTLRIATAFDKGIVIAADGKATCERGSSKDVKNGICEDRFMYTHKLLPIGTNLCAAFGGQLIRDHDSVMLPHHIIESFKEGLSSGYDTSRHFDRTALNLYEFLRQLYYWQPKDCQFKESSIFVAWIDGGNNLAIIFVNSLGNRFAKPGQDAFLIWSDFKDVLRHGPHWKRVEDMIAKSDDKHSSILRKIRNNITLNREEAIDYTLFLMKSCIEEEAKEKTKEKRLIDYPISYAIVEENRPVRVVEINE
jgi:hypothetical protein